MVRLFVCLFALEEVGQVRCWHSLHLKEPLTQQPPYLGALLPASSHSIPASVLEETFSVPLVWRSLVFCVEKSPKAVDDQPGVALVEVK